MSDVTSDSAFPTVHRLNDNDGFVVIDGPGDPAVGVVRRARKILRDGAVNLARFDTYANAAFELPCAGASVGLNIDGPPDEVAAAIDSALDELFGRTDLPSLVLDAAKGIDSAAAERLAAHDPREPMSPEAHADLVARIVAAVAQGGGIGDTAPIVVAEGLPGAATLADALRKLGRTAVVDRVAAVTGDARPTDEAPLLLVGSAPGEIDHEKAADLDVRAVLGVGPLAVTPRALAVLGRRGRPLLPDFVVRGAVTAARLPDGPTADDVAARATALTAEASLHAEGTYLGACELAEAAMRRAGRARPFGRPLP